MHNYTPRPVFLLILVFLLSCENKSKNVNQAETEFELIETTISEIHDGLKSGACTCESLLKSYLDRISTYDQSSGLNSIIITNPDALDLARAMDREYKSTGKLRPMHCIPVIVKDNYLTRGLQTTAGSVALKGFEPLEDAYQVRELKKAGAIVLAKSNMAEWAFSPRVTISSIAGETRNPYNPDYVPAGSSGGTAASVAANLGAVGLGTDTGNSIRGPSSHNALVGFRSTLGLTSRHGIAPLYLRNDVGGPMTRTVEDATRILEIIAGYDPADPVTIHAKGKIPEDYQQFLDIDGLKGARIGVLRLLSERDCDQDIKGLFEQAITDMEDQGAVIIDPIDIPLFDSLRQNLWCSMFQHDINQFLRSLGNDVPVRDIREVADSGLYADYIDKRLSYHMEHTGGPEERDPPCLDPYSDPRRIAFRKVIEDALDRYNVGAIIYPTWNHPPAKIGNMEGYKGDNSQIIAPHTGQPAFTVPMGFVGDLPAGIQFVGRMFDEPTLIKYTYAYEQATMHRKPPELFPAIDQ
jgi:Asp-tRNA(Asn)/Glu-tRNA(Gln) amidotransferase A subunit family amidase